MTALYAQDNNELIERLNSLQESNDIQSKLITTLQEELETLDEKVEEVETATLLDKVKLNLGFRARTHNFDKTMADGTKISSNNMWTTKFILGLNSDITENMKFHGRLAMKKYWGDSSKHPKAYDDYLQGRVPSDSAIYLERAYVDWYFDAGVPSALTIGRLPSADGTSHHFKENTTRKSTYSALLFEGASDGLVYTADISKYTHLKNNRLRFAYAKGFQNDETEMGMSSAFIGASDEGLKDTNVFSAFFESDIIGLDNSLFQLTYLQIHDVVASSLLGNDSKNKNLGDVHLAGMTLEATDIKESGLDLFAHYGYSKAKPNKELFMLNEMYGVGLGHDSFSTSIEDRSGHAFWLGSRYTFENFHNAKIGLEYNQGSKYWASVTNGTDYLVDKLSTKGKAIELYGIYPVNRYSFIKLGALHIDYDYTYSGIYGGEPRKIDSLLPMQKAGILEKLQSLYLQFSVKF